MLSTRPVDEFSAWYSRALSWVGRTILFASLFGLGVGALSAAPAERWADFSGTIFHNQPLDNGLPRQATRQILEDADGFLWVAAYGGLARWDGYRFRVYQPDPKAPGALPDNFIETLHNDSAGQLWIGTNRMGLVRYDREADRFITYRAGPEGLSHDTVNGLTDDGKGGLWVATHGGLDHFDAATGRLMAEPMVSDDGKLTPGTRVQTVFRDGQGRLWIGTSMGLYRRAAANGLFVRIALDAEAAMPSRIYQDRAGRIWVGTLRHGAFVVQLNGTGGRRVNEPGVARPALPGERVMSFIEARPGEIWIGTLTKGIVVVSTDGSDARHILSIPGVPQSLPDNGVNGLYLDRAGLLWVATARGIGYHDLAETTVTTLFGGTPGRRMVSEANITAVEELAGGRIWLGLRNGGVDIIDPQTGTIERIRPDPDRPEQALPTDRALAISAVPSGDVFVGTGKGLYRISSDRRVVERISVPGRPADGRTDAVLVSGDVLWFGGLVGGLWGIVLDAVGSAPRLHHIPGDQLTDPRISVLRRDPNGAIWIGTWTGLNKFDPATGTIEQMQSDPADPASVNRGFISCLLIDRRGRLWVSTLAGGLGLLERRDAVGRPRFRRFGMPEGMPNNSPNTILEDQAGRIWTSSDDGLAAIDPDDFSIRVLTAAGGMHARNFWVHSGAITSGGELLFGSANGLVMVRPEMITNSDYRPPIVVTDVRIGNRTIPIGRFNGGRPPSVLEVPSDTNNFAVEFASLDYTAPKRITYRYRLDGFDSDWIMTDASRRLARYTNLWPGEYKLRLAGTNSDGLWLGTDLEIPIRVLPSWYQTVWLQLVAALVGLALIWAVVHARTVWLQHRGAELEAQVHARTVELTQSNEALQAARAELERLAEQDVLTGLANRRLLRARLDRALARAQRHSGLTAILFVDLDRFKSINDRHGHTAGDMLLRQVADRLTQRLREVDTVARMGGDEFVVLLEDVKNVEAASLVARAVIESLTAPFSLSDAVEVTIGASIGISLFPDSSRDADELLLYADRALYDAKAAGRNQYRVYDLATPLRSIANIA